MISIHPLFGISLPSTLMVCGYINKRKLVVLIDGGYTHNFLKFSMAKRLKCFVPPIKSFNVLIVNGKEMHHAKACVMVLN